MPVQKSRKTPSKRGMHRSHDGLSKPALSVDPQSGKRVIEKPADDEAAG
jgi:large subunit ribosomal protein L32